MEKRLIEIEHKIERDIKITDGISYLEETRENIVKENEGLEEVVKALRLRIASISDVVLEALQAGEIDMEKLSKKEALREASKTRGHSRLSSAVPGSPGKDERSSRMQNFNHKEFIKGIKEDKLRRKKIRDLRLQIKQKEILVKKQAREKEEAEKKEAEEKAKEQQHHLSKFN